MARLLGGGLVVGAATLCSGFADDAKLADHFNRHGGDFGANTAVVYENLGTNFMNSSNSNILTKTRSTGDIIKFNPATNEFGVIKADGTLKTYFKPDTLVHGYETNLGYFNSL